MGTSQIVGTRLRHYQGSRADIFARCLHPVLLVGLKSFRRFVRLLSAFNTLTTPCCISVSMGDFNGWWNYSFRGVLTLLET